MLFFLEEAPWQLRSIVEFLNLQMERSEVLIVEARQYEYEGSRIVVPSLFGYTEEARRVKRTVSVKSQTRKKWDMESFSTEATKSLGADGFSVLLAFIKSLENLGAILAFGTGAVSGSVNPKWPALCKRSVLTVFTDGRLVLNFKWLDSDGNEVAFRERLIAEIKSRTDLELGNDCAESYPAFLWHDWSSNSNHLVEALKVALRDFE